ncbi:hypothetical protein GCM10007301_48240 [Azorhizobium oxalatiphilum]|uniref:Uncharacterized protein n=1 Tax=Azorhizobium oxalatiphilum TaxID=980631 RepID=A0A917CAX7_9HYPH|nr:hypothetical protein [Azorhizobium oxalatiphilum]GGF82487.1 hypothetical protein GCM10007301_48240 [Azorhizobium oxalatiphilum]
MDNRPYAEGTSAATARAGHYVENAFAVTPNIKVEWYFFKGAGATRYLEAAIKDLKLEGYWSRYDAEGKPQTN